MWIGMTAAATAVPTAAAAAAVVVTCLSVGTLCNIVQTQRIIRTTPPPFPESPTSATGKEMLSRLQSMSRRELVQLFLSCEAPSSLDKIKGDWDGLLLDNNGWIMTAVTSFITHQLFGQGNMWAGKSLGVSRGSNRFCVDKGATVTNIRLDHGFDCSLEPSVLFQPGKKSAVMRYNNYHRPWSLWYTMKDELRVVPLADSNDGEYALLIGMGCMGWSGGMVNASPFCLYLPQRFKS